jgi:hypothetical protein
MKATQITISKLIDKISKLNKMLSEAYNLQLNLTLEATKTKLLDKLPNP